MAPFLAPANRTLYARHVGGMHGVMQTLEDIPSEFFGGVLASKKQQYHLHRLPNLFPTLPTLHKFVERYVTTSELNAREGTYVVVAALGSVRRAIRKRSAWLLWSATARVQASTRKSSARWSTVSSSIARTRHLRGAAGVAVPRIIWGFARHSGDMPYWTVCIAGSMGRTCQSRSRHGR